MRHICFYQQLVMKCCLTVTVQSADILYYVMLSYIGIQTFLLSYLLFLVEVKPQHSNQIFGIPDIFLSFHNRYKTNNLYKRLNVADHKFLREVKVVDPAPASWKLVVGVSHHPTTSNSPCCCCSSWIIKATHLVTIDISRRGFNSIWC